MPPRGSETGEPLKPDYGAATVATVLPTLLAGRDAVRSASGAGWLPEPVVEARAVVLLVLDGLGWAARTGHADAVPELAAMAGSAISTVVPSTTAAALTSITTGLTPAEHGVVGFRFRIEGGVLNALTFQLSGPRAGSRRGPDPLDVQRHEAFRGRGIPTVTRDDYRSSGFTRAHLRGGRFEGWHTASGLVEQCRRLVAAGDPVVYAYYPGVDEVAHAHGLEDGFFRAELRATDRLVGDLLDALPGETALLVTADHGEVHLGEESWVSLAGLAPLADGYAGDARFRYVYARPGAAAELAAEARRLGDVAWVLERRELLEDGWLGPNPSPAAWRRVGDVVLAARGRHAFVDPTFPRETGLRAAHGSMTRDEMLVPLLAARGRLLARPGRGAYGRK